MSWWKTLNKVMNRIDKTEAIDVLARTAWGEARGQGLDGLAAVCNVIGNRVAKPRWWGNSYISVCKSPWQFSCWNEADPNRGKLLKVQRGNPDFDDALVVARAQVEGVLRDRTHGATHYYASSLDFPPKWAIGKQPIVILGDHRFYRGIS